MNYNVDSKNITVVFASDDNYAMPLAVTICSLLKHLNPNKYLMIFILDGGISNINKKRILKSLDLSRCSITWIETRNYFQEVEINDIYSASIFHRIMIPDLLPDDVNKAIYLDCDILVLKDLDDLWNKELGEHYLLAVKDFNCPTVSDSLADRPGVPMYKQLGIPSTTKYFNSGILVLNLDKWRKDNIASRVIDYIHQSRDYIIFGDQEALNAVLWGGWGELEPKWNYQARVTSDQEEYKLSLISLLGEDTYQETVNNICIKHFVSDSKPWKYYRHPDKYIYYQYLDLTDWTGWRYSLIKVFLRKLLGKFFK